MIEVSDEVSEIVTTSFYDLELAQPPLDSISEIQTQGIFDTIPMMK